MSLHPTVQSTIYMEPAPMVELNNTEAMLSSAEEEEEMSILAALSRQAQLPHPLRTSAAQIPDIAHLPDQNNLHQDGILFS